MRSGLSRVDDVDELGLKRRAADKEAVDIGLRACERIQSQRLYPNTQGNCMVAELAVGGRKSLPSSLQFLALTEPP